MITCKHQYSLTNAKSYFQEHLCGGDYYTENGRTFGQWFGTGCKLLNLTETIQEKDFLALCECKHPKTGETLTQRIKKEKRRIFSDFVISCPKSVSLVATLQDERIFDLHEKSVKVALSEMEQFACTRVRKNNAMTDRETSNMIAGLFVHDTSRSLDPMVHTHCILFNATFDAVENKWKALQNHEIFRVQKYISCIYNHELQKGLKQLGYSVHTKGTSFEIDGISDEMIKKFSKRHQAIEQAMHDHLANKGITARNIHDVKEQVRMQTRQRKNKNITKKELLEHWQQQCTEEDRRCLQTCNKHEPIQDLSEDVEKRCAQDTLNFVKANWFERSTRCLDSELLTQVLNQQTFANCSFKTLKTLVQESNFLQNKTNRHEWTTEQALQTEQTCLKFVQSGLGQYASIHEQFHKKPTPFLKKLLGNKEETFLLNEEQQHAIDTILRSRDFVTLFRGAAGTGKSYTLKALKQQLDEPQLAVCAPQAQQVEALQKDGFLQATTLAALLQSKTLPHQGLLLVDEAGQISGKQMAHLLHLAHSQQCRILLSGDTRQHGAIGATDALKLIETFSTTTRTELKQIRRQDENLGKTESEQMNIRLYKRAVWEASNKNPKASLQLLKLNDCIQTCLDRNELTQAFLQFYEQTAQTGPTLVVTQTRAQVDKLNQAIRELRNINNKPSFICQTYVPVDTTLAQKRHWETYTDVQHLVFHSSYGTIPKGSVCTLLKADFDGIYVNYNEKTYLIDYKYAERWQIAQASQLEVAKGELLQIKCNMKDLNGKKLANGTQVTVTTIDLDKQILTVDDAQETYQLSANNGLFVYGYALTSYASQGKTVDHVILFDDGCEKATSLEQWYVSISRARKSVRVFTQDTTNLEQRITKSFGQKELLKNHWQPLQYPNFSYKNLISQTLQKNSEQQTKAWKQEKLLHL